MYWEFSMGRNRHLLYLLLNYFSLALEFDVCGFCCVDRVCECALKVQTTLETSNRMELELNGGQFTFSLQNGYALRVPN